MVCHLPVVLTRRTSNPSTVTDDVERLEDALDRVEEAGAEPLRRAADLKSRFDAAVREYRDSATGRGDFGSYVEFRSIATAVEEAVEEDEVYGEDSFLQAAERFDRRTIREKHFERAERDLENVEDAVAALEEAERLRDEADGERHRLRRRIDELEEERDELRGRLERAREHDDVDASELVELVGEYDRRVKEEFEGFRERASAADVVRVGARAGELPLVEDQAVDVDDARRVEDVAGDRSAEEVLEMTGYSRSKLEHYVDDAVEFRRAVPRSFLKSFDGSAFEIGFDEPADVVRYEAPELRKVVQEFADEDVVDLLRRIRRLALDDRYEEMRRAHQAAGDVDVEEVRRRVDELEDEMEATRQRLEEVESAVERAERLL